MCNRNQDNGEFCSQFRPESALAAGTPFNWQARLDAFISHHGAIEKRFNANSKIEAIVPDQHRARRVSVNNPV